MKTPREFDYDLWIAEDGQYMVRVKATHEECAVNQDVFRKLRAEEKKVRREMSGASKAITLSTDYVGVQDGGDMDPLWLTDPRDFTDDILAQETVRELRQQLTERQLEVFEKCMIEGMSLRTFASQKNVSHTAIIQTCDAIRKKFKKVIEDTFPNAK